MALHSPFSQLPRALAALCCGALLLPAPARGNSGPVAAGAGDAARAVVYRAVADDWQRHVKDWTVTNTGPLSHHPYFIRLDDNLDPNDGAVLNVSNSGAYDERQIVDAGFLELVRLGELAPSDRAVTESLPVIDAALRETTPNGVGWHRYNHDTYGDRPDGGPWTGSSAGRGGLWPVFDGERGEYDLALGDRAQAFALLDTMRRFAGPTGLIPEQIWNGPALPASPTGTDPQDAHGALAPGQAGESIVS